MKHISIIVPRGNAVLGCIEGSLKLLNTANDILVGKRRRPLFEVQLVGVTGEPQIYDEYFRVCPGKLVGDILKTDLIIIPPVNGNMNKVILSNKDFFPWIIRQYKDGAEVASLCIGTFLLASTGLLKGKECTTHWLSGNLFRKMFPDIHLVSGKIVTDHQGIYTSGGGNSFWNLLLYIIEKYTDREVAIECAKHYAIDIDRSNQSSFIVFDGFREHGDKSVKKAQEFIEHHFREKLTVDHLSAVLSLGRRSLERRFRKATRSTVLEYIQRTRMEAAKKDFESSRKNIDEIMRDVGYTDAKAFRTVFKKATGLSPVEYRNKYNKLAVAL